MSFFFPGAPSTDALEIWFLFGLLHQLLGACYFGFCVVLAQVYLYGCGCHERTDCDCDCSSVFGLLVAVRYCLL
jgi:hypothetical protein